MRRSGDGTEGTQRRRAAEREMNGENERERDERAKQRQDDFRKQRNDAEGDHEDRQGAILWRAGAETDMLTI